MTRAERDQVLTLVREKLAECQSLEKEALALPFSAAAKMKKAIKADQGKKGLSLGTKLLIGGGLVGMGAAGVGAMRAGKEVATTRYAPPQSVPPGY